MRLREIEKILEDNYENLSIPLAYKPDSSKHVSVDGYENFMQSIIEIEKTGLIDNFVMELSEAGLFLSTKSPRIKFDHKQLTKMRDISKRVYNFTLGALQLIQLVFHDNVEEENSLVVSLPRRNISYNDFNKINIDLNTIFGLLSLHPEIDEDKIEFDNFDIGTDWIVLVFASGSGLIFFGKFISMALTISQQIKSNKILDKELEALDIDNEVKQKYAEATHKINHSIYEKYARQLLDEESDIESSAENISQLAKAFEKMNNLYSTGVSFDSSINASNKIAEVFPKLIDQETQDIAKFLESNNKQLSQSAVSPEEDSSEDNSDKT